MCRAFLFPLLSPECCPVRPGFFMPMKRESTNQIVVHCSATAPKLTIGVTEIREWHQARGWKDIGYHIVIRRNGSIEFGRPLDNAGAHVYGHNYHSVGVCMIGGVNDDGEPENNFTKEQFQSLRLAIDGLLSRYPGSKVLGHRDFPEVHKDCPCFNVREWFYV